MADKGENDNTLLKGIVDGAKKDGKNYEIPASFRLPVFYGTKEAMAKLDSLDSVKKFLQEQPEGKIIGAASYGQMAYLLFASNYEELRQKNGSFRKKRYRNYWKCLSSLWTTIHPKIWKRAGEVTLKAAFYPEIPCLHFGIGMLELYEETDIAGVDDLTGLAEISLLCDILKKQPELSVENPHNMYLSMNRMGINASSREKELAEEFIQTMLSDEIQQQEFWRDFRFVRKVWRNRPILQKNPDRRRCSASAMAGRNAFLRLSVQRTAGADSSPGEKGRDASGY